MWSARGQPAVNQGAGQEQLTVDHLSRLVLYLIRLEVGRRLRAILSMMCPLLVLWSFGGPFGGHYPPATAASILHNLTAVCSISVTTSKARTRPQFHLYACSWRESWFGGGGGGWLWEGWKEDAGSGWGGGSEGTGLLSTKKGRKLSNHGGCPLYRQRELMVTMAHALRVRQKAWVEINHLIVTANAGYNCRRTATAQCR